jgi:hypothetical protein
MVGVKLGVLVTEAEAEVVTEKENLGDPVAKELRDGSEEIWAVDVGEEETRADLVSLTLGREDEEGRADLEPLGLADSVAMEVHDGAEDTDGTGDVP